MEPETPDPFFGQRSGQSINAGDSGICGVKGGIEADHLRESRVPHRQRFDRCKIMRLVQRCQGYQRPQIRQHTAGDELWRNVGKTTMRHAMSRCRQSIRSQMSLDPGDQVSEQVLVRCARIPSMVGKPLTVIVFRKKMWSSADAFNFTVSDAMQHLAGLACEQ